MATPSGLLRALGLPPLPARGAPATPGHAPAGGAAAPAAPTASTPAGAPPLPADAPRKPIDLFDPEVLRKSLREPAPGALDDAALAKSLKELPADPVKRAQTLTDLIPLVGDAVQREPLVKALRDALAKITPFMSDADAGKKIDDAIGGLVEKGIKKAILELLKLAVGKAPTEVDRDAPPRYGPPLQERDLGEKIIKTPEIPLPWDKPKPVRRNSFEFRGLSPNYKASKYFSFKLLTPDWFEPYGKLGAGRVIIAGKEDYEKNGGRPTHLRDQRIEQKGEVKMSLAAPDEPGTYVMYIFLGTGPESHPVETLEVKA
jgi:hypothetical protein